MGFRRIGGPVVATLVSATLVVAAFAPTSLRALAWVALVPLLASVRTASARGAAALGASWGMVGAYGVTDWLPPTIAVYYGQPLWLGAGLFVSAAFVMGGVYYAAFAVVYRAAARARLAPLSLVAAAAWVTAELGRARVLTGNPWGLLGYTQAGAHSTLETTTWLASAPLALVQIADIAGVYGITFLIVAVNAALAELWLAMRASGAAGAAAARRRAPTEVVVVLALLGSATVYGATRLGAELEPAGAATEVAIAQGNLDLGSQWRESLYGSNLDVYLRLTHDALGGSAARLVVWPENAMTFFVDQEPAYRAAIARVTRPADAELLAGAPRHEVHAATDGAVYFNSAFVLAPDGEITGHYDKAHLLPFTEYFPLGSIGFLRRSFARVREFTPGTTTDPLATRAGAAGIVICNEVMFPRIVGHRVRAGAEYLVNLSNDTWVSYPEFALHQFDLASLRAVETRRYLVRASTSGPSGIIDPYGRIHERSAAHARAWIAGQVRPMSHLSFYTRHGDVFAAACAAITLIALVLIRGRGRGRDEPSIEPVVARRASD